MLRIPGSESGSPSKNVHSGSGIRIFSPPGPRSRGQKSPGSRIRIRKDAREVVISPGLESMFHRQWKKAWATFVSTYSCARHFSTLCPPLVFITMMLRKVNLCTVYIYYTPYTNYNKFARTCATYTTHTIIFSKEKISEKFHWMTNIFWVIRL